MCLFSGNGQRVHLCVCVCVYRGERGTREGEQAEEAGDAVRAEVAVDLHATPTLPAAVRREQGGAPGLPPPRCQQSRQEKVMPTTLGTAVCTFHVLACVTHLLNH